MTSEQFAYWLQGYSELNDGPPTKAQWKSIREHLALVFHKVTPPVHFPGIEKTGPLDYIKGVPQVQLGDFQGVKATPQLGARTTC